MKFTREQVLKAMGARRPMSFSLMPRVRALNFRVNRLGSISLNRANAGSQRRNSLRLWVGLVPVWGSDCDCARPYKVCPQAENGSKVK